MFAAAFVTAFIAVAASPESSKRHAPLEAAPPNTADQSPIGGIGVK
jgi:hypothetical protein